MDVRIVWGGWSCMAGYIHWAYVTDTLTYKGIYNKLFNPHMRTDVTNPKNCDYGKEPAPYPKTVCEEWCKEKNHNVIGYVKMRTD